VSADLVLAVGTNRRASRPLAIAGALALLAGCSDTGFQDDRVGTTRSTIAYGTVDATHTAVVSVLAPVGTQSLQECSGSLVGVTSGTGYVLTAAHCCNTFTPSIVVAGNDYSVGEAYLSGAAPSAPAYAVVPGSVYYDAQYAGADHDFCMLEFSGASAGMATLALPTSASDGLAIGTHIEHVGFGMTDTNTTNSRRRTGTDTVDQTLTPLVFEFTQGGASHIPGTCDGDSGGPSLVPAGAAQSQQVVVGVQSYGNATTCAQETIGGASRVSSEIGPGGFVTSYLQGTPIGIRAGAPASPTPVPASAPWSLALIAVALVIVSKAHAREGDGRGGTDPV
jgi:hypothetical protein